MRTIQINELKTIENALLDSFVTFCETNNLSYFLCGGTALGAVRHKGFIPWDDDIDVMMPREDYEIFINSYVGSGEEIYTCWNHLDYCYPFAKLVNINTEIEENSKMNSHIGIYIDIFPIEDLPDNILLLSWIYFKRWIIRNAIFSKTALDKNRNIAKTLVLKLLRWLYKGKQLNELAREYDTFSRKRTKQCNKYKGKVIWGYGIKEIMPRSVYDDFSMCQFEGKNYRVPKDVDLYLNNLYGDYMSLPPTDKQVLTHNFKAYWKD